VTPGALNVHPTPGKTHSRDPGDAGTRGLADRQGVTAESPDTPDREGERLAREERWTEKG
jgi:hypothetical protein